ncbi:CheR family methyltransferase [Magnetococcales bacterium HHB-1]
MISSEIEDIEIRLLLDALALRYGYQFQEYETASLKRRILACVSSCKLKHISSIIPELLYTKDVLDRLVATLTVSVTHMFRNPSMFLALRQHVAPQLEKALFFNIWSAGCASGEEVYSLAILFLEMGLADNIRIYATDLDETVVQQAREGIYNVDRLEKFEQNYLKAGGKYRFSRYCQIENGLIKMDPILRESVVFSRHNLAVDGPFVKAHLVLCRNVLIYFNRALQKKVVRLLLDSLVPGGYLCLGKQERLELKMFHHGFDPMFQKHRIFQKGWESGKTELFATHFS